MQSRKLNTANVGGDLGAAANELIEKNNITEGGLPKNAVMLNKELLPSKGKLTAQLYNIVIC